MTSLTLNLSPTIQLTEAQFTEICQNNSDLRFELTAKGELIAMAPAGGETANHNMNLSGQLWLWNRQRKLGYTFDSSVGFQLSNGAIRSPDASWIRRETWDGLSKEEREKFAPICPDFVIELRSKSDRLKPLQEKMLEYLDCGCSLGWMINPQLKQVEVYRPDQKVEIVTERSLSDEVLLPGFRLNLSDIY